MAKPKDYEPAPVEPGKLSTMRNVAFELLEQKEKVRVAALALEREEDKLRYIEEDRLPAAMLEAGCEGFDLTGGGRIELRTEYHCSVSDKDKLRKAKALQWMVDNDFAEFVSRKVTVSFPKGMDEAAERLVATVKNLFKLARVDDTRTIHGSTLKKLFKEQRREGKFLDGSDEIKLIGGHVRRFAHVDLPEAEELPQPGRNSRNDDERIDEED